MTRLHVTKTVAVNGAPGVTFGHLHLGRCAVGRRVVAPAKGGPLAKVIELLRDRSGVLNPRLIG